MWLSTPYLNDLNALKHTRVRANTYSPVRDKACQSPLLFVGASAARTLVAAESPSQVAAVPLPERRIAQNQENCTKLDTTKIN